MRKIAAFPVLALISVMLTFGLTTASAQDESAAPDEAAMMEAMARAGTPGEPHARLAASVGTWNIDVKMWMDPSAEPMASTGTAERRMILDGRVLVEEVTGTMMGEPFSGIGMTGYDNVAGEYWGTWNDTVTTGLAVSRGSYDEATSTYTFHGESTNPMGGVIESRAVLHATADKEVMEYYETRDGQETKTMELVYTRQ